MVEKVERVEQSTRFKSNGNEKTPSHAVVSPVKSLHGDAVQLREGRQMQRGYKQRRGSEHSTTYGLNPATSSSVGSRPKPAMSTECKDPGPLPREMSEEA